MTHHFVRKQSLNTNIIIIGCSLAITLLLALTAVAQSGAPASRLHKRKAGSGTTPSATLTFVPVVVYAAGGGTAAPPGSLAVADVNGDGKPDLIVANTPVGGGVSSVGVLLGNGDGTFQPVVQNTSVAQVGELNALAVGDVNGDGKPDLVVITCCDGNQEAQAAVLLGNGDGTFQPAVTYDAGGRQESSLALGDVNGDGRPDIVVVNWDDGHGRATSNVLLGNGDGTFRPYVTSDAPSDPACATLADVNHDGKSDLLICTENSIAVMLGNGDGTFQTYANSYFYAGFCNFAVQVADVNADGLLDMVVPNASPDGQFGCSPQGFAGILLGKGDGTFQTEVNYLAFSDQKNVPIGLATVSDLDGDGKLDVAVTTGIEYDSIHGAVGVMLGNGDGTFQSLASFDAGGSGTEAVVAADLNGDGKTDLVVANFGSGTLGVLLNGTGAAQTATALTSSLNPSVLGQSVTFTAHVTSSSGTPGGTVNFYDGATSLVSATLASGSASFSTSSLTVGSHSVTATYRGSSSFAASTSAALIQVVSPGPGSTSTSLASSFNPCVIPCHVTFTATVTSASGTPTGTVIFYDGASSLGGATLAGGMASLTPAGFRHGTHPITAAYQGSGSFDPSTSPVLNQVVYERELGTRMTMTTSGTPLFVGQAVTFSISIQAVLGGEPRDGEPITFYDNHGVELGTSPLSSGSASFTTSSLTAGRHAITAFYVSDGIYKKCHGLVTQVVDKYATTTTLVGNPNPAVVGQPITYTVTVTSSGPNPPTGSVKLTGAGELTLVNGVASVTKTNVKVGTHALTAEYEGDDASAASTSPVLEEVVNPD